MKRFAFVVGMLLAVASVLTWAGLPAARSQPPLGWWKGNLHTHSLWSDGDDYPEMIVDWYKGHGYHFLALSDHNVLTQGEKWIDPADVPGGTRAFERYAARFPNSWLQTRALNGTRQVRLKPLAEFRRLFEEAGRFLLIPSEEISDGFRDRPIHVNATNVRQLIAPQGGQSVLEVMQKNIDAVLAQRRQTGQPMFPHLNHPNFGWAVTAEELMQVRGERFFEVYNGHPLVHNHGDATHVSVERMWDIILAQRLAKTGSEPMFGIAVDDSHHYHERSGEHSNPGRGWIVVRAPRLSPEAIITAMERGDFYASTGVRLKNLAAGPRQLTVEIEAEPGVAYTTQFIGTRRGFDRRSEPVRNAEGQPLAVTRRYSNDIGRALAEVRGVAAAYTLTGDELYVRAKVISSKPQLNPYRKGDVEVAWTQPFAPGANLALPPAP